MAILTSCDHSHLKWQFSPRMIIPTSRGNSHLVCPLHHSKSPQVCILTLCTYSHLMCPPPPLKSHLMPILSTHSHLAYIFSPCVLPSTQNNIFHLAWKNSQKSHAATPIPSIRYLLRATNKFEVKMKPTHPNCELSKAEDPSEGRPTLVLISELKTGLIKAIQAD